MKGTNHSHLKHTHYLTCMEVSIEGRSVKLRKDPLVTDLQQVLSLRSSRGLFSLHAALAFHALPVEIWQIYVPRWWQARRSTRPRSDDTISPGRRYCGLLVKHGTGGETGQEALSQLSAVHARKIGLCVEVICPEGGSTMSPDLSRVTYLWREISNLGDMKGSVTNPSL